jgi:hypothetical protein
MPSCRPALKISLDSTADGSTHKALGASTHQDGCCRRQRRISGVRSSQGCGRWLHLLSSVRAGLVGAQHTTHGGTERWELLCLWVAGDQLTQAERNQQTNQNAMGSSNISASYVMSDILPSWQSWRIVHRDRPTCSYFHRRPLSGV